MFTPLSSRWSRPIGLIGLWLACFVLLGSSRALADKDYLRLEVDQKMAKNVKSTRINELLREGFRQPNSQAIFDEYYKKCVFPEWTDPAKFSVVGKPGTGLRRRILKDLDRAGNGAVYNHFNKLIIEQMSEFAKQNYHPATRYNAMLLIGELNSKKPGFNEAPDPLPDALPILLSAVPDSSLPSGVRFAGLLGVVRHSTYGAKDQESRKKIDDLLLSFVATRDVPPGYSKDGYGWFRRVAMDTLARRGSAGSNGAVAKAIASVLGESDTPPAVRCGAADALGWIRLTPDTGVSPDAVGAMLKNLFKDVAGEEIKNAEENQDYVVNASKLKARLTAILSAIDGSKDRDNANGKGVIVLVAKPDDAKLLNLLKQDIDDLLRNREYLDSDSLVPKDEPKADSSDPFAGGRRAGGRPGRGGEEPFAGPAAPPAGMYGQPQTDPAKPVSDKIIAKLIELVKKYDAF